MDCSGKGSLKMKTKLLFLLLLLAVAASRALAASDEGETNSHTGKRQSLVTPVEEPATTTAPAGPTIAADDPKQVLKDYDSLMIALTQKFSATLATIAEAVKRGEVSSEQAREMSALSNIRSPTCSLNCSVCGVESKNRDSTRIPDVEAKPDPTQESEVVMVALPFSSLQLNASFGYVSQFDVLPGRSYPARNDAGAT